MPSAWLVCRRASRFRKRRVSSVALKIFAPPPKMKRARTQGTGNASARVLQSRGFGAYGARGVAKKPSTEGKRRKAKEWETFGTPLVIRRMMKAVLSDFLFLLLPYLARARARRGAGASAFASLEATGAGKGTGAAGRVPVRRVRRASVRSASASAPRLAFSILFRGTSW